MTSHLLRTLALALACTLAMAGCAATVTRSGPAPAPLSVSPAATRAVFVGVEAASGMQVTWSDTEETRIGLGILAGNAYVNTEVEFYELPARKLLGSRLYGTTTSPAEGILSATTRKQVLAISDEVIADIRR